ncbi:hypothetical protein P8452_28728 [Trifolium repens]|nr:hypothetical protein P8452_28728 [Trifolium repens]
MDPSLMGLNIKISIAEIVTISKIVFFAFNLRLCSKSKVLFDRTMLGIALKMANCEGHVISHFTSKRP